LDMRVRQHGLTIAVVGRGDMVFVFLDGEFDAASTALLVRTLDGLAAQRFARLWVSLAGVTRIDAGGIDALLAARARTCAQRREFLIRSPSSEVVHSLEERADCASLMA
jgi:anti-anti-sigma regulatory factor